MKNKKIVSGLIMAAVATTSIWATFAADSIKNPWMTNTNNMRLFKNNLNQEQKAEMDAIKEIVMKQKNGETLTTEEQTKLQEFQANKTNWQWMWFGMLMWEKKWFWGKFMNNLTDEEKSQIENMTDAERQAFFEKKRDEFEAKMTARSNVMDKILAWQSLTSEEEKIKQEIILERSEMKLEREKRIAEREAMEPIFTKMQNGETLTTEEQTKLNEFKQNWKWRWKMR